MSELVLYDIPSKSALKAWSSSAWPVRIALNYKGIKYRTEWVEYPDIEPVLKKLGAPSTGIKADGVTPRYTIPTIYDPSTKTVLADSWKIVEYLDKTYPNIPALFLPATRGLTVAFKDAAILLMGGTLYSLYVLQIHLNMNEGSKAYQRKNNEDKYNLKLEEIAPPGSEVAEKYWAKLSAGLTKVAGWFKVNGDTPFLGGDVPCYADVLLASWLISPKSIWGEDSEEWKRLAALDDGRWGRFVEAFAPWSDGTLFEEYQRVLDGNNASCYIASEIGQEFKIVMQNNRGDESCAISMCVFVDGMRTSLKALQAGRGMTSYGVAISNNSIRKYCFAEVSVAELPDSEAGSVDQVGTIRVVICRCRLSKSIHKRVFSDTSTFLSTKSIDERSKKGGLHRDVMERRSRTKIRTIPIDTAENPFAVVNISYRPRAVLQAMGFIPPDPVVPPRQDSHEDTKPQMPSPESLAQTQSCKREAPSRQGSPEETKPQMPSSESSVQIQSCKREPEQELFVPSESKRARREDDHKVVVKQEDEPDCEVEDVDVIELKKQLEQEQKALVLQQQQLVTMQQKQVAMLQDRLQYMERKRPPAKPSSVNSKREDQPVASSSRTEVIDLTEIL
ncbi:hypothetical protein EIP91_004510 [Steccherinum ochraceum]|uniref:GST N-terminal domain-containing protein n=1 Tax=Steccherinum ochraceum TaxID=92696 RepID=A0A4R0RH67_9APHY|nr:hypothetical protein EIP91_004510 [Steccherinum ochraceum]